MSIARWVLQGDRSLAKPLQQTGRSRGRRIRARLFACAFSCPQGNRRGEFAASRDRIGSAAPVPEFKAKRRCESMRRLRSLHRACLAFALVAHKIPLTSQGLSRDPSCNNLERRGCGTMGPRHAAAFLGASGCPGPAAGGQLKGQAKCQPARRACRKQRSHRLRRPGP